MRPSSRARATAWVRLLAASLVRMWLVCFHKAEHGWGQGLDMPAGLDPHSDVMKCTVDLVPLVQEDVEVLGPRRVEPA
ncbi:hypothetical protein ACIBL3_46975 [Kribbella sp. NPDC050124]|uniref:hypothetical protein n=1 Tax=Kribbella sp. NPDC050124 TaxID=3364114 RepID=UPI00379B262B